MKFYTKMMPLLVATGLILTGCGAQRQASQSQSSSQNTSRSASMPKRASVQHDLRSDQNGAQEKKYQTPAQARKGVQHQLNQHPAVQAPQKSAAHDPFAVNLGYHIVGHQDRGAGQTYVSFRMGRWRMVVHGNSVNENANSAVKNAKKLVSYLQNHTLPIPSSKGLIQIDLTRNSARMSWDHNHQVNSLHGRPNAMLQKAVALK